MTEAQAAHLRILESGEARIRTHAEKVRRSAPMPKVPAARKNFCHTNGRKNTGKHGTKVTFDGVTYASWREAVRKTGLTLGKIRWLVQGR